MSSIWCIQTVSELWQTDGSFILHYRPAEQLHLTFCISETRLCEFIPLQPLITKHAYKPKVVVWRFFFIWTVRQNIAKCRQCSLSVLSVVDSRLSWPVTAIRVWPPPLDVRSRSRPWYNCNGAGFGSAIFQGLRIQMDCHLARFEFCILRLLPAFAKLGDALSGQCDNATLKSLVN